MDVSGDSSDINYSPAPTKRMDQTKWKKPDETAKIDKTQDKGLKTKNYIHQQKSGAKPAQVMQISPDSSGDNVKVVTPNTGLKGSRGRNSGSRSKSSSSVGSTSSWPEFDKIGTKPGTSNQYHSTPRNNEPENFGTEMTSPITLSDDEAGTDMKRTYKENLQLQAYMKGQSSYVTQLEETVAHKDREKAAMS